MLPLLVFSVGLFLAPPAATLAGGMNGPPRSTVRPVVADAAAPAAASAPMLGAIRLFQKYISPIDGARCNFSPTCSAYGHQAIHRHGPWLGVLMTADRLMRCSPLSETDAYPRLPNGRLADPVETRPGSGR